MKKNVKKNLIFCFALVFFLFAFGDVFAESINQNNVINQFASDNCKVFGKFADDINGAFNLFKIVAPLLVIITSIYDFIKAITGKVEGEMSKAFKKLMMRFVFAVVLFFLPLILDMFLSLVDSSYSTCIN